MRLRSPIVRIHSTCSFWHRVTCSHCRRAHRINALKGGC